MPTDTYVVAVISPDRSICDAVIGAMEDHRQTGAVWTLNEYPTASQLARIREAGGGCVVFLDFTDSLKARAIAAELDRNYPMATTVAVHRDNGPQDLLEFMQLGIREVISIPMSVEEIVSACERASGKIRREPDDKGRACSLYAFLPARPGSGATTIATHAAAAVSRLQREPTLLVDFDLRLGMTSFLFKLHGEQSVIDALMFSRQLEQTLWDRMVARHGSLDILGSAPFEFSRDVHEAGAGAVLDYARRKYATICVDLPGEMRDHELETIHRAREVFLVCTSDLGTLHMAKRKADFLHTLNVHPRVSVIMNRADVRGSMPIKHVEEILRLPVRFTVPFGEKDITEATQKAIAIQGTSQMAKQLEKIACAMVNTGEAAEHDTVGRKFIEFFSVTPVREKAWKQ